MTEAFRQGVDGFAADVHMQSRAWSFDPAAVVAPTRVLHGAADTMVPVAHGRHTAALIPDAELRTWPEHGHLSLVVELPQLLADLTRTLR